ncbi:MAG: hypothetical protein ASARMPREDX12_009372 [Alectoria sarmentosa]|nr:MAG: hypothetical protein ASARMPREDX12_009372 [Alectoria sarmentosa]
MLLDNETQTPEPSPTLNASSSTITSLSSQQGSQWGPSGIGTVVFGCVASVLGLSALWMMFWLRQREPGPATGSSMLFTLHLRHPTDSHTQQMVKWGQGVPTPTQRPLTTTWPLNICLEMEMPILRQWKDIKRIENLTQKHEEDQIAETSEYGLRSSELEKSRVCDT